MEERKYTRLTLEERQEIQQSLCHKSSLRQIARTLGRSKDTISREILRNSIHKQTGGYGTAFNNCLHRSVCDEQKLCSKEDCKRSLCCGCKFCFHVCPKYQRELCPKLKVAPYVCNGCHKRRTCTLEKALYEAKPAHRSATQVLRTGRSGINLTKEELLRLDGIVTPLIQQGQSPWHIYNTQKDLLMVSDKTLYSYIAANLFEATNTDLLRKVKMKPRRKNPQVKVERACRDGRTYRDFLDWLDQYPDTEVVQMDTVIGAKGGGENVLLTIHFPQSQFMLAFLRNANTARSVTETVDRLKRTLKFNRFEELFPVVLTDNGPEFSNPSAIETDADGLLWTRLFYCDPNCPYQKGSIEAGHRFLRMVLPKGQTLNGLGQEDINKLMCHINSYARKSLGGLSPLNVFARIHGNKMAKLLGIQAIPASKINLTPSLLK